MAEILYTHPTTVRAFAEQFRAGFQAKKTPAEFAKNLMRMEEIAQTPPGTDSKIVNEAVLSVVEQIDDPLVFGFGICWLDTRGFGETPMSQVLRLRGGILPGDYLAGKPAPII
ncbi:MAG: hypothetical protein JWP00_1942 [Chloroflexi bacterium]|jgi:hypothetical protein|nr:hypothetical protein [Chloroflexota bacterium]